MVCPSAATTLLQFAEHEIAPFEAIFGEFHVRPPSELLQMLPRLTKTFMPSADMAAPLVHTAEFMPAGTNHVRPELFVT